MILNCEALSLRTYPFGEGNKVAVFLTASQGLLRGVAYGATKSRSRFGACLEPLTHVQVTYRRKESQELAVLENCEIIRPLLNGQPGWELSLYSSYIAELLSEFAREQQENEKLMRLGLAVTRALGEIDPALLVRYFEFWILRLEGVLPALEQILPSPLAGRAFKMLKMSPSELSFAEMSAADLSQLENAAGKLIEYHLEKPLKAKKMLKELL